MRNDFDMIKRVDERKWVEFVPGIEATLLRRCHVSGSWAVIFRGAAGASFPAHRHYGSGEYMVLKGRMIYGEEKTVADVGDYGFEGYGALHGKTTFPLDTELYFSHTGTVAFMDDDGQVIGFVEDVLDKLC